MKSFLILDWLAKLCVMLPVCLTGRNIGTMTVCLAAGFLLWICFSGMIAGISEEDMSFFAQLTGRIGAVGAWIVYLAGFFYFLSHTAVCIHLCASLAGVYLLPEVSLPVLTLFPLAAGIYLAGSSVEIQGRIGELTVPVLLGLFLLMVFFDASGMEVVPGNEHLFCPDERLASGAYEVFACMGGMFLPLLFPYLSEKKNAGTVIRRAACRSLIPAAILVFITAASFGTEGMLEFEFPVVRVMSNVTVPGGFIQRWDIFFLMLLLFSLAFSAGSGLWFLNEITACLWQKGAEIKWKIVLSQKPDGERVFRWIVILVIYGCAAGFRDPETAVNYYRAFNLYIVTPFMILVYLLLYFRRRMGKTQKTALLYLIFCMCLTGCTAREPEDRIFPMALELRMDEDRLVMTYAWNGEEAPGSGGGGKREEESDMEGEDTETEKDDSRTAFSLREEPVEQGNLTVFCGNTLAEIQQQVAEYSDRYMDYSHVKALILDEKLEEYPGLKREVYEWLARDPAFAASLIIYPARESGISLVQVDERSDGKIGEYLENLYENHQKLRELSSTLGKKLRDD